MIERQQRSAPSNWGHDDCTHALNVGAEQGIYMARWTILVMMERQQRSAQSNWGHHNRGHALNASARQDTAR